MCKSAILGFFLVLSVIGSTAYSQDADIPDTVRIGDAFGDFGDDWPIPFSVSVSVYNDHELTSMIIPLMIDGYSGWARFDSVSFTGYRLADPSVLDTREVFSFGTDSVTVDSLVIRFEIGTGNPLPAGEGTICDLWFMPIFGGDIAVDSTSTSPYGNLQLAGTAKVVFTPQFQPGLIEITCDYLMGDVRPWSGVNAEDVLGIHKGYIGCLGIDATDPWHADVNCDRKVDLRDIIDVFDYVLSDSAGIFCECGTYSPAYYDDPGIPDTVWIQNDTLYVGVEESIDIGIINDETLRGFAFGLEWDGSATLYYDGYERAERLDTLNLDLRDYQCVYYDQVNPDTLFMATWYPFDRITAGFDAVARINCTPQSEGTITFKPVNYQRLFSSMLVPGCESMLLTEDKAAIIPVFVGGNITILPLPCGDANSDTQVDVADAVYLINYIFKSGPAPNPLELGDANCDNSVNVADAVYLINYVFKEGPEPCCP